MSRDLNEIMSNLYEHQGYKAKVRWDNLRTIYRDVYSHNGIRLIALLDAPNNDENLAVELFQNVRPPEVREKYIGNLLRLTHNYVASFGSLVDHTRNMVREYESSKFFHEFEQKRSEVISKPSNYLLHDFRNYFLHNDVLPLGWSVTINNNDDAECNFYIGIDDLLSYKKLRSISREYLENCKKESVDLREMVVNHKQLIDEFYTWVFDQFEFLHSDDIEKANRIITEYNQVLSGKD